MHTANLNGEKRQHAAPTPSPLLYRFHVALSWRTTGGTLATAGLVKIAATHEQATRFAISEIKRDRRRRYAGKMDARAIMLPNQEPAQ